MFQFAAAVHLSILSLLVFLFHHPIFMSYGLSEDAVCVCRFEEGDHVISHVNAKKKLVTHFFAKEVSNEDYNAIERETLTAKEWGVEVCVKSH